MLSIRSVLQTIFGGGSSYRPSRLDERTALRIVRAALRSEPATVRFAGVGYARRIESD